VLARNLDVEMVHIGIIAALTRIGRIIDHGWLVVTTSTDAQAVLQDIQTRPSHSLDGQLVWQDLRDVGVGLQGIDGTFGTNLVRGVAWGNRRKLATKKQRERDCRESVVAVSQEEKKRQTDRHDAHLWATVCEPPPHTSFE
jgi:hypothetical protein